MKKYIYSTLAVIAMLSVGCNNEEENAYESDSQQIVATLEGVNSTPGLKTTLVRDASGSYYDSWTKNDEIMVTDGNVISKFVTDSEGRVRAHFTNVGAKLSNSAPSYLAYYPASGLDSMSADKKVLYVTLPEVQHFTGDGIIADGLFPMIGESSTFSMPFYNLCSIYRLEYTCDTESAIDSIIVESKDFNLSGAATATFEDGVPTLKMAEVNGTPKKIKVVCDGVKVGQEARNVLISIPPGTYVSSASDKRFTFTTYRRDLKTNTSFVATTTLERSKANKTSVVLSVVLGRGEKALLEGECAD